MHIKAIGTGILLGISSAALAQNSMPSDPSSAPMAAPAMPESLKSRLTAGVKVYSGDTVVGTIASVDFEKGHVVIAESAAAGTPNNATAIMRVVPASSLSWATDKLVTTLPSAQISKLPQVDQ